MILSPILAKVQTVLETPAWITARLGDDYNWWLEPTSDQPHPRRSILDPRQVAHLTGLIDEYRCHSSWERAFTFYSLQSEIDEGRVRLIPADGDRSDVFALPVIDADGDGPYFDFLDALIDARVRKLNATGSYLQDCTADELLAELELLDADRYFGDESRHCFDEINEILEWSPAAWDDPSES